MENGKKRAALPGKKIRPALIACGLLFAISILLLFAYQKQKLDEDFESMVTSSLKIHTRGNATRIDQAISDAGDVLRTAQGMLRLTGNEKPQKLLEQMSAINPAFPIGYVTREELVSGTLFSLTDEEEVLALLARGEAVAGEIHYDEALEWYFLPVFLPMREEGETSGALYTRIRAESLLPEPTESAMYQDVQSCLIDGEGTVLFNTFIQGQGGNLFEILGAYGLMPSEISRIADVIQSEEMDSSTFLRKGETYFLSAGRLTQRNWHLVSFVRGPDVLLRSTNIFRDMVTTSSAAILLSVAAVSIVFLLFLSGKDRLEKEQRRNVALASRLQAMFEQHSALKLVFDAETGIIVDANPAILDYFGYTKKEVIGRNISALNLLPSEILGQKIREEELSGKIFFPSAPHRLKNGETRLFDAYGSIVVDGESRLFYAILFDVTDRESYRSELLQEKELLKTTLQSIGDGVVTTDNLGTITGLNSVAEKLTGWENGAAIGKSFTEVFVLRNEETGQTVENPIQKVLETGRIVGLANHTELLNRKQESIPIADSAAPIKTEDGRTFGVVMVFRDVGDEKEHQKQIEFLSYHDSLTGLYNRRYIEETMARLDQTEHVSASVVMADVNGLKITNDVFGHKAGDTLLKNVAELLRKHCKKSDLIARWGGDEFVILMPETSLKAAEAVIRKIKNAHIAIEGGSLSLSLSLGCAYRDAGKSIQTTMQEAEEYMYQQKLLDGKSFRNAIISTLLATLYEKSNETEEHSKRMEKYCHDIGRRLQLSSKEMDELSLLALLHDIGKVSINPNILQKPESLTSAEWDEMKRHPEIGYRIAQATPELAIVADLILSHHERWDGRGYPRGLEGEDIPLPCRILAVADAYDAMTNDRVYRSALSGEDAVCELEKNAGTQFEPTIVRFFLESLQAGSADWCAEDAG